MKQPAQPLATMEEAWAEGDRLEAEGHRLWTEGNRLWAEGHRLWAEANRLRAEGHLVVTITAQALYGKNVKIDWSARVCRAEEVKP